METKGNVLKFFISQLLLEFRGIRFSCEVWLSVVYFDQRLGATHSKLFFLHFLHVLQVYNAKMMNEVKISVFPEC